MTREQLDELLNQITYEVWPPRAVGGQQVGPGPQGIRGIHPIGVEACCCLERSQHKNKQRVRDMIEWALSASIK